MQVHVARAELWTLPVDAVVNPANSLGIMGGGFGGTLRRQGGDVIQQAAMQAAPIAVGAAIVTTAGQLPAKHVIHVPTMEDPGMKIGAENVRRAARAIVEEIRAHRRPNPETIYLVDTSEEMVFALEEALRNAQANL